MFHALKSSKYLRTRKQSMLSKELMYILLWSVVCVSLSTESAQADCNGEGAGNGFIVNGCNNPVTLHVNVENTATFLSETYTIHWEIKTPDGRTWTTSHDMSVPAHETKTDEWVTPAKLDVVGSWKYKAEVWEGNNFCFDVRENVVVDGILVTSPAPNGIVAGPGTACDYVQVSWNPIQAGNIEYQAYRCANASTASCTAFTQWTENMISVKDVNAPTTTAYYRVRARAWKISSGNRGTCPSSVYSGYSAGYRSSRPSSPSGIHTIGACDFVRVGWDEVASAFGYFMYRDGSLLTSTAILGTFYNDTSAIPGESYSYSVKAYNGCGESSFSTSVSDSRGKGASTPSSATVSPGTACASDSISLSASGGSGGTITWYEGGCGSGSPIGTGSSINVTAPSSSTTYYVRREASCGNSSCRSVTPSIHPELPAPMNVAASNGIFCDKVRVTWDVVLGADSYDVFRNQALLAGSVTTTNYNDTSANPDVTYSYHVIAQGTCGDSSSSNPTSGLRRLQPVFPR